jgi:hypothetical protein
LSAWRGGAGALATTGYWPPAWPSSSAHRRKCSMVAAGCESAPV